MVFRILVFFGILTFSQTRVLEGNLLVSKIINGENAKLHEFPYQVSIQDLKDEHFCGGSILNEYYVITAAHCVTGKTETRIKVIAGTLKLSEPQSTHYVKKIILHREYTPSDSWKNDIALIKVKKPFTGSKEIQYINLPNAHQVINANKDAVVIGWGNPKENGSDHLQRADLVIADQKFCAESYANLKISVYDSQICAYNPNQTMGVCNGDSGGPLTVDGKLVGIVSWSQGCGLAEYPAVYTRVSEYLDWITDNTI